MMKSLILGSGLLALLACSRQPEDPGNRSTTAAFFIGNFTPKEGDPSWQKLRVSFTSIQNEKLEGNYDRSQFRDGKVSDVSMKVAYSTYKLLLEYFDNGQKLVYESCPAEKTKDHLINTSEYRTTVTICKLGSSDPIDSVKLEPTADVFLQPRLVGGQVETPGPGSNPPTAASCSAKGQTGDDVYGNCIAQNSSWYVAAGEIYRRGQAFTLKGINWFGLDSSELKLHGLWTGRTMQEILNDVKSQGFNALRIPITQDVFTSTRSVEGSANPLEQLKTLLKTTEAMQMAVLLDFHACKAGEHLTGAPEACSGFTKQDWLSNLRQMAELAKDSSYVVGIDLYNEPYKLTWDQWRGYVDEGARVVLSTNPRILVFVEGVGGSSPAGQEAPFFGENLFEADSKRPSVPMSRLVYSPHAYGPSVYADHKYFKTADFPRNMPAIWEEHFGHLRGKGYAIAVGEFGGKYTRYSDNRDKLWQDAFVAYLQQKNIKHFFYWSLNPNSGDTNGLFLDDWRSFDNDKLALLKPILR